MCLQYRYLELRNDVDSEFLQRLVSDDNRIASLREHDDLRSLSGTDTISFNFHTSAPTKTPHAHSQQMPASPQFESFSAIPRELLPAPSTLLLFLNQDP